MCCDAQIAGRMVSSMRRVFLLSLGCTALVVVVACTSGPGAPDQSAQLKELAEQRAAIEQFMREGDKSPIPRDKMSTLLPLRYYEPDLTFSTAAQLDLSDPDARPVAEMPTSTGKVARYERVGFLPGASPP